MRPSEKKRIIYGETKAKDVSLRARKNDKGIVDMVIVTENYNY